MPNVSANQLKTRGVCILEPLIKEHETAVITVRGKSKYVVMDMETYNRLRECELEAALIETRNELAGGDVYKDTVDDHIRRIKNAI